MTKVIGALAPLAVIFFSAPFSVPANAFQGASTLLAEEPFAAFPGALNGVAQGFGWAAGWQVQNNSSVMPGYNIAIAAPLTYSGISQSGGYAIGGIGWQACGRLLDTSAGGAFSQFLNNGLIGRAGRTLYFSLLMRKDIDTDDPMSVTLHSGNPSWWVNTPGIAIGHFGDGSNKGGTRYWSLQFDGTIYQTAVPVVVGQTAFLVARIDFAAITTISLYVNPGTGFLPATAGASGTTANPMAFQSLAFYGGSGNNQSSIGEIRFAGSYSALVAGDGSPPAQPTGLSAAPGNADVTLSWNPVSGAASYDIYQIVKGSAQLQTSTTGTGFVDSGLTNGVPYTYYVVASNSAAHSRPSAQVIAVPRGPAPPAHPTLGTNLTQVADYSRAWPFVDAFKTARPWIAQAQGASWGQGPPLQLNASGWITSLQPGQFAETILYDNAIDDRADFPVGQYTLIYDGSGTLSFDLQSATIISRIAGRMVVKVEAGQNGIYLIESATDPANPIRNIRFILPGFEGSYASQPFHPLFLKRLGSYGVLRFMEWMLTNGSAVQNWSDRSLPTDYTYSWRGVPLEVMIQLANRLNAKPWFNIPAKASDDYMLQFAKLTAQNLNHGMNFFLEYSNETWNTSFSQFSYVQGQGMALSLSSDPTLSAAYYTAYRSVQMFAIFESVLGGAGQMTRIIASQAANSWLSAQTLGFRNAFAEADALAIAPYFNCSDTAAGGFGVLGDPSTASQVNAMSISRIEEIELAHINGCAMQEMRSNALVAQQYGLKMIGYEGGQSLVGFNGAENDATMAALFKAVNRDGGMNSLYTQYLNNWVEAGGDLFVHYSDMGAYAKYGNFGALEYQDQDPNTSPKYQALITFAAQHP